MAISIKLLKSAVESDTEEESPAIGRKKTICNICVQEEARYTCPRCNISYCCLNCYRHKKHEGCSESFYREWVMDKMKEYVVRPEDRQKVLEMLSREREQQATDSDDDDDVPELNGRLEGLDLDADGAEVWKQLTVKEREDFAHMLKDGRLSRLVTIWTPWWVSQTQSLIQEAGGDQLPEGFPPHVCDIPDIHHLLKGKPSVDIKHNMLNVLLAYAFVIRLHNGDHHDCPLQCSQELLKVCDVLKHNVNYPGVQQAVHAIIQEIQKPESGYVVSHSLPVLLLEDLIQILQGPKVSPLCGILSALSDLLAVLKEASRELKKSSGKTQKRKGKVKPPREGSKPRPLEDNREETNIEHQLFLTKKKVTFLLSWTQRFGMCLMPLCDQLSLEVECVKCEAADSRCLQTAVEEGLRLGQLQPQPCEPRTMIQELS